MSDERTTPPIPILRGDNDQRRKWAEKIASGAKIPAIPEGERGVSFILTPEDTNAYARYVMRKQWLILALPILAAVAFILWTVLSDVRHADGATLLRTLPNALLSILLPVLVFVVLISILRYFTRRQAAKSGLFDPITLSISPESITNQSPVAGTGKIPWTMIRTLHRSPKRLSFQLQNNMGWIVPLWAFNSPQDADFFFEEAQGYWRQATTQGKS